jgi:uncharacterized membrane protein
MTSRLIAISMVCFCALLAALGQLCFKLAANQSGGPLLDYLLNPKIISGVSLYGVSAIIYLIALKKGDLSTLYPFIATSYVWVSIFAIFVLSEPFGVSKLVGLSFVLVGLYFIGV